MAKRVCLFCGKNNEMSNEHVLPQWLLEALGIRKDTFKMLHSYLTIELNKRQHNLENLVNGRVCKECNNGWMSSLESRVKDILLNIIYLNDISFIRQLNNNDDIIRDDLIKWCYKTAIVLNNASNYRELVPIEHFRKLFLEKSIPHNVTINMGLCMESDVTWVQSQQLFIINNDVDVQQLLNGNSLKNLYKITMQIGHFLFKVIFFPQKHYIDYSNPIVELHPEYCLHTNSSKKRKEGDIFYKDIHSFDFETIYVL